MYNTHYRLNIFNLVKCELYIGDRYTLFIISKYKCHSLKINADITIGTCVNIKKLLGKCCFNFKMLKRNTYKKTIESNLLLFVDTIFADMCSAYAHNMMYIKKVVFIAWLHKRVVFTKTKIWSPVNRLIAGFEALRIRKKKPHTYTLYRLYHIYYIKHIHIPIYHELSYRRYIKVGTYCSYFI